MKLIFLVMHLVHLQVRIEELLTGKQLAIVSILPTSYCGWLKRYFEIESWQCD